MRIRLATLCLAVLCMGLITALIVQERRIRRLDERVADLSLKPSLPTIPPNGTSPFDVVQTEGTLPSTPERLGVPAALNPDEISARARMDDLTPGAPRIPTRSESPFTKEATNKIPQAPSPRSAPTPSNPTGAPLADRIRALDDQINELTKERDRLRQTENVPAARR